MKKKNLVMLNPSTCRVLKKSLYPIVLFVLISNLIFWPGGRQSYTENIGLTRMVYKKFYAISGVDPTTYK